LEGRLSRSLLLVAWEGLSSLRKGLVHLMVAIMTVDRAKWVCLFRRRITGIVGDMGGRRDRALRPFGYHAVMIARACA
jgi:hypothetical protein